MPAQLEVAAALAQATRDISESRALEDTLNTILGVARDSMTEIDHIGITINHSDGSLETRAATDGLVLELDRVQYDVGEGPCLHAIDADTVVRVEHADRDPRWPLFLPRAVEMGLRAQLGIRLDVDEHTRGALNMYSFSSDTISAETEQMAELFAAHVGLALGHAQRLEHLNAALASRKVIGMALGLVMQRHDLNEQTAFAYLTRLSATQERKLRDVAASVIDEHRDRITASSRDARPG